MVDVRIGRWFSPDPIVKPWESVYAGFANNPIWFTDPSGLDATNDPTHYTGEHQPENPKEGDIWTKPGSNMPMEYNKGEWTGQTADVDGTGAGPGTASASEIGHSLMYDAKSYTPSDRVSQPKSSREFANDRYESLRQQMSKTQDFNELQRLEKMMKNEPIPVFSGTGTISQQRNPTISEFDNQMGESMKAGIETMGYVEGGLALYKLGSLGVVKVSGAFAKNSGKLVATESRVWEVGAYNQLRGVEPGLQAHHVGQKSLMTKLIPEYNAATAPSILVPEVGHVANMPGIGRVAATKGMGGFTNARQVLARDIFELRRVYGGQGIPNISLQQLIKMNKDIYPGAFVK